MYLSMSIRVQMYMCAYSIPTCPWLPFQSTLYGFLPSTISYISGLYLRILRMLKYLKYYNIHNIRNISFSSTFSCKYPGDTFKKIFLCVLLDPGFNNLLEMTWPVFSRLILGVHRSPTIYDPSQYLIYMELYCSNNKYLIPTQRYWSGSFTIYKYSL